MNPGKYRRLYDHLKDCKNIAIYLSSGLCIVSDVALFQLQRDLSDLSIDPMLKSQIRNTLKSMGLPNVSCTGLSKPILVLTANIDVKDRHQRSTTKIDQDQCREFS